MYTIVPYGNNYLLTIGGGIESKRLVAFTERIENGSFSMQVLKKMVTKPIFLHQYIQYTTYIRKELSEDITYLKVGSFNLSTLPFPKQKVFTNPSKEH